VRLLHELAKIHATFDDPHLVSHAGLVPVMALAQRAGLGELAFVDIDSQQKRVYGHAKQGWLTLVAAGIERVAAGIASGCPARGGRIKAPARPR
jgi:hypothetical protein